MIPSDEVRLQLYFGFSGTRGFERHCAVTIRRISYITEKFPFYNGFEMGFEALLLLRVRV
jgi:hypothetical protein